jgi:hypothetical protein
MKSFLEVAVSVRSLFSLPWPRTASFDTSFLVSFRQWVDVAGEHSRLTYDDFCISKYVLKSVTFVVLVRTLSFCTVDPPKSASLLY